MGILLLFLLALLALAVLGGAAFLAVALIGRRAAKAAKPEPSDAPDPAMLVPRIKHAHFLAAVAGIPGIGPDDMPLTEPLAGDLLVTYALDMPGAFRMLRGGDMRKMGLTPGEVHAAAMANLRRQVTRIEQAGESPLLILATGGDMEACLLLMDEVWDVYAEKVPGDLVVAVPARNAVFVTGSKSEAGLQVVRATAAQVFKDAGNHALCADLLVRRTGRWRVLA